MGTNGADAGIMNFLFGRTRRVLLARLLGRPDQAFYFRELVRQLGLGLGAAQRELRRLEQAGIVRRQRRGNQTYYQADPACPVFAELRGLVVRTFGVADVLRAALAHLVDRIQLAFVFGSLARGADQAASDIDLCIIGDVSFADASAAVDPAQKSIAREINITVYPLDEARRKLAAGHHFLTTILREPKIMLIGGEHELEGLVAKRLAGRASPEPARNRRPARRRRTRSRRRPRPGP